MSLINDMLNDLEQRRVRDSQADVDLSWFLSEDMKPNMVEKPQFWVFGILITAIAVSLFLHFSDPIAAGDKVVEVEVRDASASIQQKIPVRVPAVEAAVESRADEENTEHKAEVVEVEELVVPVPDASAAPTLADPEPEIAALSNDLVAGTAPIQAGNGAPVVDVDLAPVTRTESVKTPLPLNAVQLDKKTVFEAQSLLRKGDNLGAERLLRGRLEDDPAAIHCAELLASLLLSQERYKGVEALYAALQVQGVDSADLRTVMGRSYLVTGQPEKAVKLLSRSGADVFASPGYYEVLALAAQRSQRYELSSRTYQKLLQTDPKRGDWWIGLAIGYDQRENFNAARVAYERALRFSGLSVQLDSYARQRLAELAAAQKLLAKE